jgi:hypothetical protein
MIFDKIKELLGGSIAENLPELGGLTEQLGGTTEQIGGVGEQISGLAETGLGEIGNLEGGLDSINPLNK